MPSLLDRVASFLFFDVQRPTPPPAVEREPLLGAETKVPEQNFEKFARMKRGTIVASGSNFSLLC